MNKIKLKRLYLKSLELNIFNQELMLDPFRHFFIHYCNTLMELKIQATLAGNLLNILLFRTYRM